MSGTPAHPTLPHLPAWAANNLHKLDRHLLLALVTDFADHVNGVAGPFKIMARLKSSGDRPGIEALFSASPNSTLVKAHLDAGARHFSAAVDMPLLEKLALSEGVAAIEWGQPLCAQRTVDRRATRSVVKSGVDAIPQCNGSVLLGLIDHGFPFAHQAFRVKNALPQTRCLAIWDQDPLPDFDPSLKSPAGFGYGRQVTRAGLNQCIAASLQTGLVNEDECYKLAKHSAMKDSLTHGSHTAGLFAGNWCSPSFRTLNPAASFEDAASKADLVFVQLPRSVLQAPSHGGDHQCILDGIRYIISCAGEEVKAIVIVSDYGSYLGPHDGSSFIELAMQEMVAEQLELGRELKLVFPSGNGYKDQSHATATLSSKSETGITWRVPASSEVANFAEIWLPNSLHAPALKITFPVGGGQQQDLHLNAQGATAWPRGPAQNAWFNAIRMDMGASGTVVLLRVSPTWVTDGTTPQAQGGRYDIEIGASPYASEELVASFFGCWGGENLGFARRSGQARWLKKTGAVTVGGKSSVLGTACGADATVIAGVIYSADGKPLDRARYSGAGPTRGAHKNPDFAAMSDDSTLQIGVLGLGTRSGATARMWGTSVAAPVAGRVIAVHSHGVTPIKPIATKKPLNRDDIGAGVIG